MDTISLKEKGDQKIQNLIISNINQIFSFVYSIIFYRTNETCASVTPLYHNSLFRSIFQNVQGSKRNFYKLVIKEAHVCPILFDQKIFQRLLKRQLLNFVIIVSELSDILFFFFFKNRPI